MIRRRDDATGRDETRGMPASVPELARALRRARTRQGLRLEDVSARTGLPLEQLQVLEVGAVDRIPDRVAILRTLRRYADHLGLPGDRFVLAVVDQWPTTIDRATSVVAVRPVAGVPTVGPQAPPTVAVPGHPLDTGVVPVAPPPVAPPPVAPPPVAPPPVAPPPVAPPPVATAAAGGALLTGTGPAPATRHDVPRAAPLRPSGSPGGTAHLPVTTPVDTGVVPAYQPPAPAKASPRRRRTPLGLRILVGVAAVAVLAGVAGLLVDHYEPHWLRDLGITHAPQATTPSATSGGSTTSQAPQPSFAVASTTADSATLAVRSPSFTVEVTAVNGSSWVQATAAGNTAPTFAGVLTSGGTHTFSGQHSLVMIVGSVAAHLAVSVQGRTVGTYVPTAAPFTVTLQTVP